MQPNAAALVRRLRRPWLTVLTAVTVVTLAGAVILHLWAMSLMGEIRRGAVRYSTTPPVIDAFDAINYASDAALLAAALVVATIVGIGVALLRRPTRP